MAKGQFSARYSLSLSLSLTVTSFFSPCWTSHTVFSQRRYCTYRNTCVPILNVELNFDMMFKGDLVNFSWCFMHGQGLPRIHVFFVNVFNSLMKTCFIKSVLLMTQNSAVSRCAVSQSFLFPPCATSDVIWYLCQIYLWLSMPSFFPWDEERCFSKPLGFLCLTCTVCSFSPLREKKNDSFNLMHVHEINRV